AAARRGTARGPGAGGGAGPRGARRAPGGGGAGGPAGGGGWGGGPGGGPPRGVPQQLSRRTPFPRLVELIRSGPPPLSVYRLPGMDERLNLVEFFVHHEDVRRGADGWKPRELADGLADALWQRLLASRLLFRPSPVGR